MHRSRTQTSNGQGMSNKSARHGSSVPMRADRFDRHRAHHREHLCHDIRCQEADQEIRETLRRY